MDATERANVWREFIPQLRQMLQVVEETLRHEGNRVLDRSDLLIGQGRCATISWEILSGMAMRAGVPMEPNNYGHCMALGDRLDEMNRIETDGCLAQSIDAKLVGFLFEVSHASVKGFKMGPLRKRIEHYADRIRYLTGRFNVDLGATIQLEDMPSPAPSPNLAVRKKGVGE